MLGGSFFACERTFLARPLAHMLLTCGLGETRVRCSNSPRRLLGPDSGHTHVLAGQGMDLVHSECSGKQVKGSIREFAAPHPSRVRV